MADKRSMILRYNFLEKYKLLSDAQIGILIIAMIKYSQDGIETDFDDPLLALAFNMEKTIIDDDNEKYAEKCRKNSENGRLGGRPSAKKRTVLEKTEKSKRFFEKPKKADNEDDYDNDADNDNDAEDDADNDADANKQHPHPSLEALPEIGSGTTMAIIQTWNALEVTKDIRDIKPLSRRSDNTRLCIGNDRGQFMRTLSSLDDQAFFRKRAKTGNKLTYDWFCDPNNYQKVVEGNYKDEFKTQEEIAWSEWEES